MANKRKSRRSSWVYTLVVIGAVVGGVVWYRIRTEKPATQYQTVKVTRGNVIQVVTATGQLNPVVNVQVGSQISGIVKKIYVDYNSVVKSNQVIAEIDPSTYKINVLKAKATLASAKATMELNQVEARREEALYTNKLVSASDYDTAVAQLHQSQAQVQSDEATLKNAEVQLSYCTIYAPVDGVVISRNVDVGQTVAASFNTPTLFVIANDLAKMQIDALVSEADIGSVAVGEQVNFNVDAYPYRTFHGVVSQIRYGPITNQNVVNYDAVIHVDNSDLKLLPGMTANVSIVVASRSDVLKVNNAALRFHPPEEALAEMETNLNAQAEGGGRGRRGGRGGGPPSGGFRRSGGGGFGGARGGPFGAAHRERSGSSTVYLLDTSKGPDHPGLKPVKITTGINDGVDTEVVSGLKEGQKVVVGLLTPDEFKRPVNPFRR